MNELKHTHSSTGVTLEKVLESWVKFSSNAPAEHGFSGNGIKDKKDGGDTTCPCGRGNNSLERGLGCMELSGSVKNYTKYLEHGNTF